jgi:hypothetical protein
MYRNDYGVRIEVAQATLAERVSALREDSLVGGGLIERSIVIALYALLGIFLILAPAASIFFAIRIAMMVLGS